jgi:predicted membrane-bound spermidine synthase
MNNTRKGDVYSILNVSGNPSWILAQNCTWDIDIVDIPNPTNNLYANVYSINDDTVILDSKQSGSGTSYSGKWKCNYSRIKC